MHKNYIVKKFLFIGILGLISIYTSAQFSVGVEGGMGFTGLSGKMFDTTLKNGFQGGLITELQLPILLGVEMDVKYAQKGAKGVESKYKLEYIDVPILLKLYTIKVFSLQLGPQYSFLLNARNGDVKINDSFKKGDVSALIGLGFDLKRLHGNVRYNIGLRNISNENDGRVRNRGFEVSLGYWFKKKK